MKKKVSLMLCLVIMILTMTACGTDPASVDYFGMAYEDLKSGMERDVASLVGMTDENRESIYSYGSEEVIHLLETWDASTGELGPYQGLGEFSIDKTKDSVTTEQIVHFPGRDIILTYVYTYDYEIKQAVLDDATVDLVYTIGEQMGKAAMNTVLGMGTVFAVLILISLIIYAFNLIPYIQKKFSRKWKETEENAVVVQIERREEQELTDDCELVAVITAAIAAGTGASADSFVVRSIHRR